MKRLLVVLLLLAFALQPVRGDYVDLILSYPENVDKGEEIQITFEIINQSNEMLWDGRISIEDSLMDKYKSDIQSERDYQANPFRFSTVGPGKSFKETFVLTFSKDFPLNEASFNILLKCGKGPCRGGCKPFYLEKNVTVKLNKKRAEVVLKLDVNEFTSYRGETLEIPFTLENVGGLQIKNIKAEIKGDILSDNTVNISAINPQRAASGRLFVSIDENNSKTSFNPLVVIRFQDPEGREGVLYQNISINVIEKEKIEESNASEVKEITNEAKTPPSGIFYFFLLLSIFAVVLVIIFLMLLFKR
ncbi:MAG: hypothetical protein KO464_00770 [Candidatus Methanofastidiosum sp.]|nr:hypothetical protein [Methanofastidiosum sp.]